MAHYYTSSGELKAEVPNKSHPGKTRPTTIRDARENGWLPSATTILSILDKPMINDWKVEQAIRAVITSPPEPSEDVELYIKRMSKAADEVAQKAADLGTHIHAGINAGLSGLTFLTLQPVVKMVVNNFWPWYHGNGFVCQETEKSFTSPLGYAGTIDWIGTWNGHPAIADWKSQDFDTVDDARFYDTWALQLAAYDMATSGTRKRLSVVISRSKPGLVTLHEWSDSKRWDEAWLHTWQLWKRLKNWEAK